MQSLYDLKLVKSAMIVTVSPPYSSWVAYDDLPDTSGQLAKLDAHLMPKRFLSCVARPERWSPMPDSQMICASVQPAGCPYSSWHSSAVSTIS